MLQAVQFVTGMIAYKATPRVTQALLQLAPNESWDVLTAVMGERPLSVLTSTAQTQVVGKRREYLRYLRQIRTAASVVVRSRIGAATSTHSLTSGLPSPAPRLSAVIATKPATSAITERLM